MELKYSNFSIKEVTQQPQVFNTDKKIKIKPFAFGVMISSIWILFIRKQNFIKEKSVKHP